MPDVARLLAAYDAQLRARVPDRLPLGVTVERDGPLLRILGFEHGGFVTYRDLGGLDGGDLDELIARQVQAFEKRSERFEWKLRRARSTPQTSRHDCARPASCRTTRRRLSSPPVRRRRRAARRFLTASTLREVSGSGDLERIAAMEEAVWGDDHGWLEAGLQGGARGRSGRDLAIVVAEADETVVCAGWVRFERPTDFATLWGGATLPQWRGRGIYRAIGRVPREPRGRARLPLPPGRCVERQPADPRAPRVHGGDDRRRPTCGRRRRPGDRP